MHKLRLLLSLMLFSCSTRPASNESGGTFPSDSTADRLIREKYTIQNRMDGIEFATVDSLRILSQRFLSNSSIVQIIYYIDCSFQAPVRAPGHETGTPPGIHQTDSIELILQGKEWKMMIK